MVVSAYLSNQPVSSIPLGRDATIPTKPSVQDRVSMPYDVAKLSTQLKGLTLEEKISLLAGASFATTAAVPRLGIKSMKLVEGVNGVKDAMQIDSGDLEGVLAAKGPSTVCFPGTTCLAATWNTKLMYSLGVSLAYQAREKDIQVLMGPGLNIHRDPRGGRNFEYFSEDPLLSGRLAGAIINGAQSEGVGACAKHFVANDAETLRRKYDIVASINSRAVREISMAAFQEMFRVSNPVALMTAYNKIDGHYCAASPMLKDVVRAEWGYDGAIMSDWFGCYDTVPSIEAGLDLEMPGPPIFRGQKLLDAIQSGEVTKNQIDQRTLKMLEWIEKCSHPTTKPSPKKSETIALTRKIASEGITLLKNDGNLLPLKSTETAKVTVVGLHAIDSPVNGGGSSLAPAPYVQQPLTNLQAMSSNIITFAGGVKTNKVLPMPFTKTMTAKNGLNGVDIIYRNSGDAAAVRQEFQTSSQVLMLGHLPPGVKESGFTYEIRTNIRPNTSGHHTIGMQSTGGYELFINDVEVLTCAPPNCIAEDYLFNPIVLQKSCIYDMEAGQSYAVKVVVQSWKSDLKTEEPSPHGAKLCFEEIHSDDAVISDAVTTSKQGDISIVFMGRNPEHESEGFDLDDIYLPGNQAKMVKSVAKVSKKTIVVIYSGGPIDVSDFVDDVDVLIHAHYLGQEGGSALADVIYGHVNPSGKVVTTWPGCLKDVATYNDFPVVRKGDTIEMKLVEGIEVGYRRKWPRVPRFPFGFGLSYTTFAYSNLVVRPGGLKKGGKLAISITVSNTGEVAGAEVVQLYVSDVESSVVRPEKELKGFDKIFLEPKCSTVVEILLDTNSALSYWEESSLSWKAEKGEFRILIGDQTQAVTLTETFSWNGL